MTPSAVPHDSGSSRREFLKTGATAGLTGSLLGTFAANAQVYADGSDTLRIGLVGCGGRGTGAANQALLANPNNRLVALGDAFPEQTARSLRFLQNEKKINAQIDVTPETQFAGLDAYRHVIDACDVVLLAEPPGFRPQHLAYAVEQGKHIFAEKPMATDSPGVRSVMASVEQAKQKNLKILAGFCWRYHARARGFFEQILSGAVGDPLCVHTTYLAGPVKPMPDPNSRPVGMSDLEWMVRNWYNFTWLSGDGLVEQACHTVDWIAWAKGEKPPVSCVALGGRQIPNPGGNIFDHITVNYVWEDGSRAFQSQRQMTGCSSDYACYVLGNKGQGTLNIRGAEVLGEKSWKFEGDIPDMYQVEHDEFFKAIREDRPFNDGDRMVTSTLLAIMGRMSGYSGREVTWEEALNSEEQLTPPTPDWNAPVDFRPMAMPGLRV